MIKVNIKKNTTFLIFIMSLCITFLFPFNYIAKAEQNSPPSLVGKSAVVMDIDTNEIIYSKNADNKMYPASITKLLTSLILADNTKDSDKIIYSQNAKKQPEYSLDINVANRKIKVGQSLTSSDTLNALLLLSANDLAYAISDTLGGSTENFANMMNAKAKDIGMNSSHFANPNGLHDDNHYSTAYDLALLGKASYEDARVKNAINLKSAEVKIFDNKLSLVKNSNKNLGYDGCIGGKTGFTDKAGRCLLAIYERSGRHLVGVVLNSVYDAADTQVFKDMKNLINYAYSFQKVVTYPKDTVVENLPVKYKSFGFFGSEKTVNVPILLKEDISQYENDINKKDSKLYVKDSNSLNISKNNSNTIAVTLKERNSEKDYEAYYTDSSISEIKTAKTFGFVSIGLLSALLIFLVLFLIMKSKNKRRKRHRR